MKYSITFYLISVVSFICMGVENDTGSSESGYTSDSESSDSESDNLPLGYSISFECLHCSPCQQVGIQDFVSFLIQSGALAPDNSETSSLISVQLGTVAPENSEITSLASVQLGTVAPDNSEITSLASVQLGAVAPENSEVTSVSSEQLIIESHFYELSSANTPPLNSPDSSENNDQDHMEEGCFSFIRGLLFCWLSRSQK